jgi:hypothetical protein
VNRTLLQQLRLRLLRLWSHFTDTRLVIAQNHWTDRYANFLAAVEAREDQGFDGEFLALEDEHLPELLVELAAIDFAAWRLGDPFAPPMRTRDHWLIRRVRERVPHEARQRQRLYTYMRHHAVLPRRVQIPGTPTQIRIEVCVDKLASWDAPPSSVRVEAVSFADGARLEPAKWRGIASGLSMPRAPQVATAIATAADRGVDVVVFPELTIVPGDREVAVRALRDRCGEPDRNNPAMVVLGSFHQQIRGKVFNTTLLIDRFGQPLGRDGRGPAWRHVSHCKLAAAGDHEHSHGSETIDVGDVLTVYVTPLGLTAVAICKDYLDGRLTALWQAVAPDLILVPAYGRGMSAHHRQAIAMRRQHGTVSIVAHECDGSRAPDPVAPGSPPDMRGDGSEGRPASAASGAQDGRASGPEPEGSLIVGAPSDANPTGEEWRFRTHAAGDLGTVTSFGIILQDHGGN